MQSICLIRQATIDDIPQIARIHRAAFFAAMPSMVVIHTPEEDREFFGSVVFPTTQMWLAERENEIAGFIAFRPEWVDHLYIDPGSQRSGMGTTLLRQAQGENDQLQLWAFQCNHIARNFYEKHGFMPVELTEGEGNEHRRPDVRYLWRR